MDQDRQNNIDDLTLALLYLTRFQDREGREYDEISWKNHDFDAIERLDQDGLIINSKRKKGAPCKYAYMTQKGRERAREILKRLNLKNTGINGRFEFRAIRQEEADEAVKIEQICFPPNEACLEVHMKERIAAAPELFLVAISKETGQMAGFLNGIATPEMNFRDEFFTDIGLHKPDAGNIMLLGLDVLPQYRKQGLARELVFQYCRREEENKRKRLILTCHEEKIRMYQRLGFRDLGMSASTWGGESWHEMEIMLDY